MLTGRAGKLHGEGIARHRKPFSGHDRCYGVHEMSKEQRQLSCVDFIFFRVLQLSFIETEIRVRVSSDTARLERAGTGPSRSSDSWISARIFRACRSR